MKKITVLSGKGGVGKSSITASLAVALSKSHKIIAVDCDVDASNLALVFGMGEKDFIKWNPVTTNQKAVFNLSKCTSCKKCLEACYFNAIEWKKNKPKLKQFGCEGCGVCALVCPEKAIKLVDVYNAKIGYGKTKYGFHIASAQLEIGHAGSGKVVAAVRNMAEKLANNTDIMLVDSAAGIGCPVIASVVGTDYVIAVTEPTPSGFADMKRALSMVTHFKIPYGIIINKYDINQSNKEKIENFAKEKNIEILAKIPYNKKFVEALVKLIPIIVYDRGFEKLFHDLAEKIIKPK